MQDSTKIIGIGVFFFFAITVLGLIFLFNNGLPIFDPGITENDFRLLKIERKSTLPFPSDPYLNISESQINQCLILKTACQELIGNNQDLFEIEINSSEFNCITSFLESLSPEGTVISLIYYQGFFFEIALVVA